MKKEKILLLCLLIVLGALFILCGFSLVKCFVYSTALEEGDNNVLEIGYLFIHLIMNAIIFYLAFRGFKLKISIMNLLMLDDSGNRSKKALIISGVLSGVFFVIGIYSTLHILGLPMPPLNYLSLSTSHDLMNAGFLFGAVALTFFLYPFLYEKEDKKSTE